MKYFFYKTQILCESTLQRGFLCMKVSLVMCLIVLSQISVFCSCMATPPSPLLISTLFLSGDILIIYTFCLKGTWKSHSYIKYVSFAACIFKLNFCQSDSTCVVFSNFSTHVYDNIWHIAFC